MGTNPFRHVRSGEPLVIPATTYNAMVDAAQGARNRRLNLAPHGAGFESLFIHVVNTTGRTLQRFGIVGLDGSLATNNLDSFCERMVFKGVVPTHEQPGTIAILQEDALPEMSVRACVYGASVCQIDVKDEDHLYAAPVENETGWLASTAAGPVRILAKAAGTGKTWAYVLLGVESPSQNRRGVTQAKFTQNANRTASVAVKLYKSQVPSDGQELGTEEVDAYCLRAKSGDTIESGKNVILIWMDGHFDMEPEC